MSSQKGLTSDFLACLIATVIGTCLAWVHFPAGGNDDSYISYWSAYALSEYGRLINYNGEAIEQSSSLLLVMILAAVRTAFGLEPQRAGPLLSIVAGLLTLPVAVWVGHVARVRSRYAIPLLLSVCTPFVYWSTSGMETSLVGLVSLLAIASICKCIDPTDTRRMSTFVGSMVILIAVCMARPETALVLIAGLVGLFGVRLAEALAKPRQASFAELRRIAVWVAMLGFVAGLLMVWRIHAFGSPFPNPAVAKSHSFDWGKGIDYLLKTIDASGPFFAALVSAGVLAVLVLLFRGRASSGLLLGSAFALGQVGFVCVSGGDWMPAGRLLAPAAPMLALLAGAALDVLSRWTRWGAIALVIASVSHGAVRVAEFGRSSSNSSLPGSHRPSYVDQQTLATKYDFFELFSKGHRRDARLLEKLIPEIGERLVSTNRPFTMMSGQAGMVPYYIFRKFYGKGQFLDLFSLTSRKHLPCIEPSARRERILGIWVSAEYVLEHPDRLAECDISRPDIWFSTGKPPAGLKQKGFRLFYASKPNEDALWAALADRDD